MKYLICTLLPTLLAGHTALAQPQQTTVYFDYDQFSLTAEARQALTAALAPLRNGYMVDSFSVTTHCDSAGSHVYNDRLAQQRLHTIISWLHSAGVRRHRVASGSFGKRRPLNDNSTPELQQLNRRAELVIYYQSKLKKAVLAARNNDAVTLKNIEFVGSRHAFMESAQPALAELLHVMKEIPTLEIEIQGHICCLPGNGDGVDIDTYTYDLSVQRAKAVYDHLVNNGIAAERMRYRGFGHQFPLNDEITEEEKAQNRRVEIRILKK